MKTKPFSLQNRFKSFGYAFNGLRILLREEPNARIHLVATVGVLVLGFVYKISLLEWLALVFAIGLVWSMEIINTSIENLSDFITTEKNEKIKKIKDLAASGVLVSALTALMIGLLIFVPKIFRL